jgi:hypothetical protein
MAESSVMVADPARESQQQAFRFALSISLDSSFVLPQMPTSLQVRRLGSADFCGAFAFEAIDASI